jgi:hypothetical protein
MPARLPIRSPSIRRSRLRPPAGNDNGFSVTRTRTNTYTGGTTSLAGRLIVDSDASLGALPTESVSALYNSLTFEAEGLTDNVTAAVQAAARIPPLFLPRAGGRRHATVFQDVSFGLQLEYLALEPRDLQLFGLHLTWARNAC